LDSADIVNLILAKLRRVKFLVILNRPPAVRFEWGGNEYTAVCTFGSDITVYRWVDRSEVVRICDNYQQWVEGVLNGKTRDADGVLS
jgi:hypothetical protein